MKRVIALIAVLCMSVAFVGQGSAAPQGYSTFAHPQFVASYMVNYLNADPKYSNVHATEVNRWRIKIKGRYTGYLPFTAIFTKVGRQSVRVTLSALGQHSSNVIDAGFDL